MNLCVARKTFFQSADRRGSQDRRADHQPAAAKNMVDAMRVTPIAHNQRQCKCADCKKTLAAGEGIQHSYPMFHGNGQFYYCCPPCDKAREITEKKIVDELKDKTDGR